MDIDVTTLQQHCGLGTVYTL